MTTIEDLYLKGLVFLDDIKNNHDKELESKILETFFQSEINEYKINILKSLQKGMKNLILLKKIVKICDRMITVSGLDIPIEVRYIHHDNNILPVHVISDIKPFNYDVDIYINRIVIPIYHNHSTDIEELYKTIENLYRYDSVSKIQIYENIGRLFKPLFYHPTGDRKEYFIEIDYSRLNVETEFFIGSFTSTETSRFTLIGDNVYIENIENDELYFHKIPHNDKYYEAKLLSIYDRFNISKSTESIGIFLENKKEILQ